MGRKKRLATVQLEEGEKEKKLPNDLRGKKKRKKKKNREKRNRDVRTLHTRHYRQKLKYGAVWRLSAYVHLSHFAKYIDIINSNQDYCTDMTV